MAATFELRRATGADLSTRRSALYTEEGQTFVEISTLDSAQHSSGYAPIGKPTDVSIAYSMECFLYLKMTKAPDNTVNNIRFWSTDTAIAQGIYLYVATTSTGDGITPTSASNNLATNNAMAYYGPDESFSWDTRDFSLIGDYTKFLVLQYNVNSAAGIGDEYGQNSLGHYSYDES